MHALIVVDLQNDFLPGEALAVPRGQEIVDVVNAAMEDARRDGTLIVATQDCHPPDHGSFASRHPGRVPGDRIELDGLEQILWPDHCVEDTQGCAFASELRLDLVDRIFPKGQDRRIDSYSGFHDNGRRRATGLGDYLREHDVTSVTVLGLATDYCVKATALDAVRDGFTTTLRLDACRGVELEPGDVDDAVAEMRTAGVRILNSADMEMTR